MFHLSVFSGSLDATADVDCPAVTDEIMAILNSHVQPQEDMMILAAAAHGALLDRARIVTPSIRQFSPVYIRPVEVAALFSDVPAIMDLRNNPLTVRRLEEIEVEVTNTGAGPTLTSAGLWLSRGPIQPAPAGDVYTIRGTGTTTLTAGAWSNVAVTWQDTLPTGRYACVGLGALGTTVRFARLVFDDQTFRPGCIGQATVGLINHPMFQRGGLGVWGTFSGNRMPNLQYFATAADTAQTVFMDFVRTA